jgi:hypothetical protein
LYPQVPLPEAQVPTPLAGGAGQGVHDVGPQVSVELLDTHMPEQTWCEASQLDARQVLPEQVVVAAPPGQSAQTVPLPHSR